MKKRSTATKPSLSHQKKQKMLQAMLREASFQGWSESAYDIALKAAKVSKADALKLCPEGVKDLVLLLSDTMDDAMHKRIRDHKGFARLRVREKVGFALRVRLEELYPHREAVRRLMLWYANPYHGFLGVKRIARIADLIWIAAGDTSKDYNYYTKRFLLAAVIKMTLLYWLQDETVGSKSTWEFLEKRLAEVVRVGKTISLIKEWNPSDVLDLVRSQLRRA